MDRANHGERNGFLCTGIGSGLNFIGFDWGWRRAEIWREQSVFVVIVTQVTELATSNTWTLILFSLSRQECVAG